MIKLSVNETIWSILLARTRALPLILFISIEYLISGPKSYRDIGETGPCTKNADVMGLKPV